MEELRTLIQGEIGSSIVSFETIDSTNTLAMELGDKGASHGTVIIADSQTRGRGRLGRNWVSPPGINIYMSVILRPSMTVKDSTVLTIMAGVACCRALKDMTTLPVRVKWPNDLMVSHRKLGGILTETRSVSERILFAVMGIGIDVNMGREAFPPDIREIATSVLHETGRHYSRTVITASVLNALDYWYRVLSSEGKAPVLKEWRNLSSVLGKQVKVTMGEEMLSGTAEDIDNEGMLLLRLASGQIKTISAGDLAILR